MALAPQPPPAAAPPLDAAERDTLWKAALDAPSVWLQTTDDEVQEVEREVSPSLLSLRCRERNTCLWHTFESGHCAQVALLSPHIQREVLRNGNGISTSKPIELPKQVFAPITWCASCGTWAGAIKVFASHSGVTCLASVLGLPFQVTKEVLALILEYCRYHRVQGRSDKVHHQSAHKLP